MATSQKSSSKSAIIGKYCIKCGKVLPLENFAPNKDWTSQQYHDVWCLECAKKNIKTVNDIKQYCQDNNRHWEDSYYEECKRRGQFSIASDQRIQSETNEVKRAQMATYLCAQKWLVIMNAKGFYQYEEHDKSVSAAQVDGAEASVNEDGEVEKPVYNSTWGGYFTPTQISEQEMKYDEYVNKYDITEPNHIDSIRKLLKASLNADIAADRYRRGEINAQEYRQAQQVFMDYSKDTLVSAIMQSKQKQGTGELDSLGIIIDRLESTGRLGDNDFQFEPDQIDQILADFRHTIAAVGQSIGGYE